MINLKSHLTTNQTNTLFTTSVLPLSKAIL